jgi:hypothetical protein
MTEGTNLIPISDAQAEALKEATSLLRDVGGFLRETFGTVPEDVVGLLGGDYLKVKRAENLARTIEKARKRLNERKVDTKDHPAPLTLGLPIMIAAADENRDELQDIWAALLAAAADPARSRGFRLKFIEIAKKLDPLDAAVLNGVSAMGGRVEAGNRSSLAASVHITGDQLDVSMANLLELGLLQDANMMVTGMAPLGLEFLRAIAQ